MESKTYFEYKDENLVYNHRCFKNLEMPDMGSQIHDIWEIIYLKEGDLSYIVEGKTYQVKKNSLILTRPENRHLLQFNEFDIYDRYDALFDETIVPADICAGISPVIDVLDFEGNRPIVELFERMDYYCKYFEGDTLKRILAHLIEEVFYNIMIASEKRLNDTYTANPMVIKAVDFIDRNLHNDFCLDALCGELFITKSYLHQLFVKHLQISPKKYIIAKQLTLAQREIRAGASPTSIYGDCGFSNYSTFYRAYKNHFGYAPSEETERKIIREIHF